MGKLILIWIELPFIIKAFLFIIILYLYLMLCMQLYTRTETIANRIRKWRYKRITDQYLELIEQSLEQIESGVMIGKSDLVSTEPQDPDLVNFEGIKKSYKISNIPNEINDDSLYVYILNSYEGDKEELINYQIKALKGVKINQCILAVKYFGTNKYEKVREIIIVTIFCMTTLSSAVTMSRKFQESKENFHIFDIISEDVMPVSIILPAYNEVKVIIDSVFSLTALDYKKIEIIVVNDGSTDETLSKVIEIFELNETYKSFAKVLKTEQILNIYEGKVKGISITLVNKKNGGKADALNAGINVSKYPLFIAMDSDCIIKKDALAKIVKPFLLDKRTIAVGGNVKISNNLRIEKGEIAEARKLKGYFLIFQTLEYLRVFLVSRIAWNNINTNIIISGAFGIFKRSKIIEVGGYRTDTVSEDMELVMRLNKYCIENEIDYKIQYVPEAYCFTQVPTNFKDFRNQRIRWHVGLMQSLQAHKSVILNPKYKKIGLLGAVYYTFFELFSSIVEISGYIVISLAVVFGLFNPWIFLLLIISILVYSFTVTISALMIEKYTLNNKKSNRDAFILLVFSIFEPLFYRQVCNIIRIYAMIKYKSYKNKWNKVEREEYK